MSHAPPVDSTSDEIGEYFVLNPSSSGKPDLAVYQFQNMNDTVTNSQDVIMVDTSK